MTKVQEKVFIIYFSHFKKKILSTASLTLLNFFDKGQQKKSQNNRRKAARNIHLELIEENWTIS